jgi:hypothetical protein
MDAMQSQRSRVCTVSNLVSESSCTRTTALRLPLVDEMAVVVPTGGGGCVGPESELGHRRNVGPPK